MIIWEPVLCFNNKLVFVTNELVYNFNPNYRDKNEFRKANCKYIILAIYMHWNKPMV